MNGYLSHTGISYPRIQNGVLPWSGQPMPHLQQGGIWSRGGAVQANPELAFQKQQEKKEQVPTWVDPYGDSGEGDFPSETRGWSEDPNNPYGKDPFTAGNLIDGIWNGMNAVANPAGFVANNVFTPEEKANMPGFLGVKATEIPSIVTDPIGWGVDKGIEKVKSFISKILGEDKKGSEGDRSGPPSTNAGSSAPEANDPKGDDLGVGVTDADENSRPGDRSDSDSGRNAGDGSEGPDHGAGNPGK